MKDKSVFTFAQATHSLSRSPSTSLKKLKNPRNEKMRKCNGKKNCGLRERVSHEGKAQPSVQARDTPLTQNRRVALRELPRFAPFGPTEPRLAVPAGLMGPFAVRCCSCRR